MVVRKKEGRRSRRGWRGVVVLTGCVAVVAGAGYWVRTALLPRADAQTPPAAQAQAPGAVAGVSDYAQRVVAYVYESEPITREQLGDYLIDRHGDKLELLVH